MEKLNLPKWLLWIFVGLIAIIIILFIVLRNQNTDIKIINKKSESKELKKEIDSLDKKIYEEVEDISEHSKNDVKQSEKLIKSLPNEKANVRPDDYDSMCKYLSNYRPD